MRRKIIFALCIGLIASVPVSVKPISNRVHVGASVATAIVSGIASGALTYVFMKNFDQEEEERRWPKILIPLGVGILGACVGGGATYWMLYPYSGNGKIAEGEELLKALEQNGLLDVHQALDAALSNANDQNNQLIIEGFIRSNSNLSPTPLVTVQDEIGSLKKRVREIERLGKEATDGGYFVPENTRQQVERCKSRITQLENFILVQRRQDFERECMEHDRRNDLRRNGKSFWEHEEREQDRLVWHRRQDRIVASDCNFQNSKGDFIRRLGMRGNPIQPYACVDVGI